MTDNIELEAIKQRVREYLGPQIDQGEIDRVAQDCLKLQNALRRALQIPS